MKRLVFWVTVRLAVLPGTVFGRGVSPYLPLNLDPEIERQVERVLILAGKPVMTRPIAAATVLEALPKACHIVAVLCSQVRRYLDRFIHKVDHCQRRGCYQQRLWQVQRGSGSLRHERGQHLEHCRAGICAAE
jgi:hypothetical protein